jgi:hypothetical protein
LRSSRDRGAPVDSRDRDLPEWLERLERLERELGVRLFTDVKPNTTWLNGLTFC